MGIHYRLWRGWAVVLTVTLLLTACGSRDDPEALLASARDYLAKDDAKAAAIQIKNALQKDPGLPEARFLLGKALLQSGDPVGAEVELRKAMDAKYSADQVVPMLAHALLASGQAKKLLSELKTDQLATPDAKVDLQTSIASAQAATGQLDKARAAIDVALGIKPDYAPTMIVKARLMASDNDLPGALNLLEAVLAKDPKNHDAWKFKGDVLGFQKDAEGALAAYRKALDAKPDSVGAHAAIFAILVKQNKLDEADAQLQAMKKILPKNPATLMTEAEYLYQKKDFKRAQEVSQDLLKVAPNDPRVLLVAGAIQFQLNSMVQAEDFLSRALKLSPGATLARRMLTTIYLRTGQPARALTMLEPMLAQGDNSPTLLSLAGETYLQNGNPQKAEEYFARASALDPSDAPKQTKVALTHLIEGKTDAAVGELERIASADTGTTADMALIATAIRRKDFATAMKAVSGLEKKQPDNPLVHSLRGTILVAKNELAAARKSFEKALSIKPGYFPAAASLAGLDLKEDKPDDARKRFEAVLAADPKNMEAMLALAELKARAGGSADEVAALIGKAVQASPNEPGPRLALIKLRLQNKEASKAVAAAQDAAAAIPDRVEILDALGRAQQAAGDTNQALAAYSKLVSLMPGSPQPYLRMADVNVVAKNKAMAIQNLRKALELAPDSLLAQRGLIMLCVDAQNYLDAQSVIREVKRQRPKEAIGFLFEGDLAASRKDWPGALTAYQAGLKQAPSSDLAIKVYAALYAGGKAAEAEKFASGWLTDHQHDAGFRMAMAESATMRKEFATAIRHYQALLTDQPNNALLLNNIAWALGQLKDPRALDYAEKANRVAPNQPELMETLGSLLAERGELPRALELLQKAIALAPESPMLRLSLARTQIKAGKKEEARKNLEELAKLGDKFSAQADVARLMKEAGG